MFETERSSIRRIGSEDAGFMLAMLTDRGLRTHIGDRGVRTLEDAQSSIRDRVLSSYQEHGFGMYIVALKDSGKRHRHRRIRAARGAERAGHRIAFLEPHTGRGYGQEAARALIPLGAGDAQHWPAAGDHRAAELASAALLRTLGFRETGRVMLPAHGGESRLFVEG